MSGVAESVSSRGVQKEGGPGAEGGARHGRVVRHVRAAPRVAAAGGQWRGESRVEGGLTCGKRSSAVQRSCSLEATVHCAHLWDGRALLARSLAAMADRRNTPY